DRRVRGALALFHQAASRYSQSAHVRHFEAELLERCRVIGAFRSVQDFDSDNAALPMRCGTASATDHSSVVRRLASRARSQRPSDCLRRIVSVYPERRTGLPPGGIAVSLM